MTTRIVRRGLPAWATSLAAAVVMPMPEASSMAPVPGSQLSRWPPRTITSSGASLPRISPEMFQAGAAGLADEAMSSFTRTGLPRSARRSSSSASGGDSAAAGMPAAAPPPVWGSRVSSVEIDRIR